MARSRGGASPRFDRRYSDRRRIQRARTASKAQERLAVGRIFQARNSEKRRCRDSANRQLSLLSGLYRISRLRLAPTGDSPRSDGGHLQEPCSLWAAQILRVEYRCIYYDGASAFGENTRRRGKRVPI